MPPALPPVIADLVPWLAVVARRIAGRPGPDADDLFAAALLGLWKDRAAVLGCENPVGMAMVVGKRAMLGEHRQQRRHRRTVTAAAAAGALEALAGREPEPANGIDEFDVLLALVRPQDVPLLERRYRGGLVLDDIAAELGVTRPAVRERIERAVATILSRLHT